MLYNKLHGVKWCRLKPPRKAVSSVTGFPTIHTIVAKLGSKVPFKNELMLAYGTAWKTTRIKGTVVAQPTIRKFRIQWTIGEKDFTSEHGAAFFKDQQPVSFVTPPLPLPNVATQDAQPALSEQDNEDFGRERDVDELQIEDESDESSLSGEQHVLQTSPDANPLEPHGQKWECSMVQFQFVSELQQDWA